MQSKWKIRLKRILALAIALLVLNVFCYWYYNPTAYLQEESHATDVIREPGAFTSRMKEGFAWATMDANGYNNASLPGEEGIYALMMGTSHTEGMNVLQYETTSAQLNDLLAEEGIDGCAYNIGISSHVLMRNAANLQRALERFRPREYVVIETPDIMIYRSAVESAVNDSFERIADTDIPLPDWITRQPLMKAVYRQWMSLNGAAEEETSSEPVEITREILEEYEAALGMLFAQMQATAVEYGVEIIIVYHPHLMLQEDGSALPQMEKSCLEAFARACEAANVHFLDMTQIFMQAYEQDQVLPHGFANTAPGTGHLNPDGCRMVAEALCSMMVGEGVSA